MMLRRFYCLAALAAGMLATSVATAAEPLTATAVVHGDQDGGTISRHLYGHFAEHLGRCVYDGLWVGTDSSIPNTGGVRNDVLEALKKLKIPNLRWPGGCFADDYHWRDGIGPVDQRPETINIHWGQVIETNAFGTHEFLELCELLDAEPYLAGNVGSGSPEEMRDWIEYLTFDGDSELANLRRKNGREKPWRIEFFGVGNENWGCGGSMRPEYYADLYRRYAEYCRDLSGNRLTRVACGPSGNDGNWTRTVMERVGGRMQALSLHQYTLAAPWHKKLPATGFDEAAWFAIVREALSMEKTLDDTEEIMDKTDPQKRIGLFVDEWGTWYDAEPGTPGYALYQQNSLRDAMVAGVTLHIFHDHCERVRMANIAQIVNVLQAMILTEGDKMVLTPSYHVFEMYKVHQDATRLPLELKSPEYSHGKDAIPAVSASASRDKAGKVHVSLVNVHPKEAVTVTCELPGVAAKKATGRVLTGDKLDAHNTFNDPDAVAPQAFDGAKLADGKLTVELPARSVVVLELAE
jgi:alpha-N-arabinofuranosidase